MMFYLDMESEAKNMRNLVGVKEALLRVTKDLQQKIDRGQGEETCHGDIKDGNGNTIGEFDFRKNEDIKDGSPFTASDEQWDEEHQAKMHAELIDRVLQVFSIR